VLRAGRRAVWSGAGTGATLAPGAAVLTALRLAVRSLAVRGAAAGATAAMIVTTVLGRGHAASHQREGKSGCHHIFHVCSPDRATPSLLGLR
jgi:hypothetical protein